MANPNPQHTPTDGLGVAAYVQVTGTNVVNNSGGAGTAQGTQGFPLGQGIGAAPSSYHPNAQYELTLSLSAATVNGVTYAATCQLTTVIKDVANTTYTPVGSPVYRSYGDPANKAGSAPAWYHPSNISGMTRTLLVMLAWQVNLKTSSTAKSSPTLSLNQRILRGSVGS